MQNRLVEKKRGPYRIAAVAAGLTLIAGAGAAVWYGNAAVPEATHAGVLDVPLASAPPDIVPQWPPQRSMPDREPPAGWPQLFGPTHESISFETGLLSEWPNSGPPEKWRHSIGTGYSAPVALGERVVIHYRRGDQEIVECLDAESGESIWTAAEPTRFECEYEYSNGPYATPVLDGDFVYALGAEGKLRCLNFGTGEHVWQRNLSQEYRVPDAKFGVGASPLLEGDLLILNTGGSEPNSGIVALDRRTGATRWTATDHGASYATPRAATIHGTRHLFVFTSKGLICLEPNSGREHWEVPFGMGEDDPMFVNAVSPLVHDDLVLVVAGPGPGALCLRILPDGGYEEVWRNERILDSQYNNLICINGYVYGYTSMKYHGRFRCLHLETGALMWDWRSRLRRGSGLAVDGRLILLGERGELALLEADYREPVVRAESRGPILPGPCYNAPALHRGLLYLRNEQELLCLNLRKPNS